jgi:hypothetical protein
LLGTITEKPQVFAGLGRPVAFISPCGCAIQLPQFWRYSGKQEVSRRLLTIVISRDNRAVDSVLRNFEANISHIAGFFMCIHFDTLLPMVCGLRHCCLLYLFGDWGYKSQNQNPRQRQ